jgi:predicted nucleotidyltransferase
MQTAMNSTKTLSPEIADELVRELIARHQVDVILLYGSFARGDANPESDLDFVCLRVDGESQVDARDWNGFMLDGWIYPRSAAQKPEEFLRLCDAKVLLDRDGIGHAFLEAIKDAFKKPITPLLPDILTQLEFWCHKMLKRAKRGDAEGNFRRLWLQHDLLEIFFQVRCYRYCGPKLAISELKKIDARAHEAFLFAIEPGASFEAIEKFVDLVFAGKVLGPST